MSELEELPSWAGRSVPGSPDDGASDKSEPEPQQPEIAAASAAATAVRSSPLQDTPHQQDTAVAPVVQTKEAKRRRRPLVLFLFGFLGLCALAGMAALGYFLAQSQDSNETEASAVETTEDADQLSSETATEDESGAAGDDSAEADTTADDTASGDGTATEDGTGDEDGGQLTVETDQEDGTDDAGGAATEDGATDQTDGAESDNDRQAVFRGGKVYLSGSVPSEEVGQFIQQKAEAVVGPGNVVNEYVIDPDVVIAEGSSAPLYVEDVVLFEFNSVEVAPPFLPILDLGTLLLSQNPQASVTVVTRTDAVGSEAANLEVSRLRAQAIVNYWLGKGVNADQIEAQPLGEEGASDDDDAETAALNRRAEFIITGLLD